MPATDRRGFISWKLLLLLLVLGAAGYSASHLREWSMSQVDANTARSREFDRRVQAQRLAPLKHDLERAGIHVDVGAAPADSTVANVEADVARPTLMQRVRRFWARLRGEPEPVQPLPLPVLTDSMGLRPGERMFLPGGRVVEYDTTIMHVYPNK